MGLVGICIIWLILWPCYLVTAWNILNFHLQIHQSSWSTRLVSQSTTICRTHTNTPNFMVIDIYTSNSQGTQSLICLFSLINQSNIYWATLLWSWCSIWCNRKSGIEGRTENPIRHRKSKERVKVGDVQHQDSRQHEGKKENTKEILHW